MVVADCMCVVVCGLCVLLVVAGCVLFIVTSLLVAVCCVSFDVLFAVRFRGG